MGTLVSFMHHTPTRVSCPFSEADVCDGGSCPFSEADEDEKRLSMAVYAKSAVVRIT
jgi:hypothetical protein